MEPEATTPAAESSPAPQVPPIEQWTDAQRDNWLKTGDAPEPPKQDPPKTEESAPSTEPKPDAGQKAEPVPDSETGKSQEAKPQAKGAESRKVELDRQIQDRLRQRREIGTDEEFEAFRQHKAAKPAESAPAKPGEQQAQAQARPKRPDLANFDTVEEFNTAIEKYDEDLEKWHLGQVDAKFAERDKAAKAEEQKQAQAKKDQAWHEQIGEARKRIKDFDAVIENGELRTSQEIGALITQSELGADILYYLSQSENAELAQQFAIMTPLEAAMAIGRIEATLQKPKELTPAPKKITTASKPPTEVGGKNTAPEDEVEAAVASGDVDRYMRVMNAREIRK